MTRHGIIYLKEPFLGNNTIIGHIEVLENKVLGGFSLCDDCKWIAKISTPDDKKELVFFGCQVRALGFMGIGESIEIINNQIC